MCGIAGVLRYDSKEFEDDLSLAVRAMHHRGPDQSGVYQNGRVGLAHCRLSIIDLSERGRQPMHSADGKISIVFNGEIYNFLELRKSLAERYDFLSECDTEVLIAGYQEWGIDKLLEKIDGMYTFAIWDGRSGKLYIVRDRCGKKPLFYTRHNGRFFFASTLVALLAMTQHQPEVSLKAVSHYLNTLSVPSPYSIYEGVQKLPAACRMEVDGEGKSSIERYWRLSFDEKEERSDRDWIDAIESELQSAVKSRLISDVPIVAFLSGGVDSSLVAAMMAKHSDSKITTVSIGFPEEKYNELRFAKMVAQKWGTDHHEHMVDPNSIEFLPHIIHQFGEPFGDHSAVPSFLLSEVARKHGTVVLTGDGGDEGFGGYETARMFALHRWLWPISGFPMDVLASRFRSGWTKSNTWQRKAFWLAEVYSKRSGNYVFDPIGARNFRFQRESIFSANLINAASQVELDANYTECWNHSRRNDWADRSFRSDFEFKLPNTFLPKVDVATMAHSLEARSPFLDYKLLELAAKIPSSVKVKSKQSKWLLKKVAERYVDKEVIYRRKQGFTVPLDEWFRGRLKNFAKDVLLSESASSRGLFNRQGVERMLHDHASRRIDHGQRIWSLVILELWFRIFMDRSLSKEERLIV